MSARTRWTPGGPGSPLILVLILLLGAAAWLVPPGPAAARGAEGAIRARAVVWEQGGATGDHIDRWWGVAGAVLCGTEAWLIRRLPPIGMNPYLIAAGIGGCILALIDVKSTQ